MGMFDYVRFQYPCKNCGITLDEWQTKHGPMSLETIELCEINRGLVYTNCDICDTWNQYRVLVEYAGAIREIPVLMSDKEIFKCSQGMVCKVTLEGAADFYEKRLDI